MFKPLVPKDYGYLDKLKAYYARQFQLPTVPTAFKPFTPKTFSPTSNVPPSPTNPTAGGTKQRTESAGLVGSDVIPFPTQPSPPGPNSGPLTSTMGPLPTNYAGQGLSAELDLTNARIANTKRQLPADLIASWDLLGRDWWIQFSTWQQKYVNEFLKKYAAGDFTGANDVARSWYDLKDKYASERQQSQQEQDYLEQQTQYRNSARIG